MIGKTRQMISDLLSMNADQVAGTVVTNPPVQNLLRWLTHEDAAGETPLSRLFEAGKK